MSGFDGFAVVGWLREFVLHGLQNFLHLPVEAVGFVDAADVGVAETGAQNLGQLAAVAVNAFIINLHDEHVMKAGENIFQTGRQRVDVTNVRGRDAVAGGAGAIHGFANGSLGGTPADEQDVPLARSIDFRNRERGGERLEFLAPLGGHLHVKLRRAGWVAQFVMFQAGRDGIFAAENARAGHDARHHTVQGRQIVGLVIGDRREIGIDVLTYLFEIRLGKGFDARGDGLVAQDVNGSVVFPGDVHGFDGGVKTILDIGRRDHDPRRIAVSAEAGDVEVGLLDVRRHAGGGSAALDVHHDKRYFSHPRPADRFSLERDARAAGASDRHAARITRANGHGDGGDFIFALNERAAVLGQFTTKRFHDVRPRCDGVTRAETNARGNETESHGFVAVHDDLLRAFLVAVLELEGFDQVANRITVTGVKCQKSVLNDA